MLVRPWLWLAGMHMSPKIKTVEELAGILDSLRQQGKRIVLCHGVFDLLHVGHLRYFQEARRHGDVLVVTLTTDAHVNRGPHRPAFPENLRAEALAELASVDFVAISRHPTAVEVISRLKPNVYAKGPDYKDAARDITGMIGVEQKAVEAAGGRIVFTGGATFSSSALINRHVPVLPPEVQKYLADFSARHGARDVLHYLENAAGMKVLLVGEAIIDEYEYCDAVGKSSKEPTLVVKRLHSEQFAGGILAAANHVAGFCDQTGVLAMLGDRKSQEEFVESRLRSNIRRLFIRRDDSPTIVKRRIVENYHFHKLIEIYEINDAPLSKAEDDRVCQLLAEHVPQYDLVIVIDFGHCMLSDRAVGILQDKARFLAVNVQSNAGNLGYHALSKYRRAGLFTATENEMRLEARSHRGDLREIVQEVGRRLECPRIVVTRGRHGCLCYDSRSGFLEVPAVADRVVDRIGAGDAFLSVASLLAQQGAPMDVIGFAGNAAGAMAVATVGNREPVDRVAMFKQIESLLK